jgi:hypothetical protein
MIGWVALLALAFVLGLGPLVALVVAAQFVAAVRP